MCLGEQDAWNDHISGSFPTFYMISGVKKRKSLPWSKISSREKKQKKLCFKIKAAQLELQEKKVSGKEIFKIKSILWAKIPVRVRLQNKSLQRTK